MKYPTLIFAFFLSSMLAAQPAKRLYTEVENVRLINLMDSTRGELLKLVATLTDSQFFYHIDSSTWSANDIVEHLGLIDEGYVRELWFTLSQPAFPANYVDSVRGGDEKALAYANQPEKGRARGTNLPRNRYCNKETCVRIFSEANDLAKQFYTANAAKDLRRYFIFRLDGNGVRTIRDAHQLGLLLVAHRMRHIDQLKRIVLDPRFPK
ncbi:MAG TPA: DinB family protein [Flavisolibacter sp.]|nr:DinB family protein [Flavisolibacter sp.]